MIHCNSLDLDEIDCTIDYGSTSRVSYVKSLILFINQPLL